MSGNVKVTEVFFTQNFAGAGPDDTLKIGDLYWVAVEISIGAMARTFISGDRTTVTVHNLSTGNLVRTETVTRTLTPALTPLKDRVNVPFPALPGPADVNDGDILVARCSYSAQVGFYRPSDSEESDTAVAVA
ncbi:hypothetical protein ACFWP3_41655 [Streptomyces sp. NPDC058525]|uniref:hypothetical protein n=1 Tax=Streptomyces sp. NPDC058525 TaxID=3346538 RepID=UPI00365531D4